MTHTGLAPGDGDKIAALAASGMQMFAVPQPLPGLRNVELAPAAEVRVITLVRASREMSHTSRRNLEEGNARRRGCAPLSKTVWTGIAAHVAKLTVSHDTDYQAQRIMVGLVT
jgi:hypothetical protein